MNWVNNFNFNFNFNFNYKIVNCNDTWGNNINGTWTGVIGQVLYQVKQSSKVYFIEFFYYFRKLILELEVFHLQKNAVKQFNIEEFTFFTADIRYSFTSNKTSYQTHT